MKFPCYCLRDNKANSFAPPQCFVNEAVAKRWFDMQLHNDRSLEFSPNDYDLYYIGNFDSDVGTFESVLPEFIVNGGELF